MVYWDHTLFSGSNAPAVLQQADRAGREARWKLVVSAQHLGCWHHPYQSTHPPIQPITPTYPLTLDPSSFVQIATEPPGVDHPIRKLKSNRQPPTDEELRALAKVLFHAEPMKEVSRVLGCVGVVV